MSQIKEVKKKIYNLNTITKQIIDWKKKGDKIVFTNGVFDILHLGHIDYLAKAADLGTRLVIGLNDDESVKKLVKGPARPIKNEETRVFIIASLKFVDGAIIFSEKTPFNIISKIIPHILVKGGDYDPRQKDKNNKKYIVGSDIVAKNGGKIKVIPFLKGHSTTLLENKIISLNKKI